MHDVERRIRASTHQKHFNVPDSCDMGGDDHGISHDIQAKRPNDQDGTVVDGIGDQGICKGCEEPEHIHRRDDQKSDNVAKAQRAGDSLGYNSHSVKRL